MQQEGKREFLREYKLEIIVTILGFVLFVVLYVIAHKDIPDDDKHSTRQPLVANKTLEVEVIDGVGNSKVAQHAVHVLRLLGYDVVEFRKSDNGIVERSYVLDRSGDFDNVKKLAISFGITEDKVFQKIDKNLYVDVTVVIGKDFSNLKTFQSFKKDKIN